MTTEQLKKGRTTPDRTHARLHEIKWDFEKAVANRRSIHSFHSYPARFIPEIPRAVIHELKPAANSLIFDPFCGCGTTLVEAQHAGYGSVGVDLNPIGCLISRVKTTPLPLDFSVFANRCIERARKYTKVQTPQIPNLLHWFQQDVCEALAALRLSILKEDGPVRQGLEAAFSSIIVRVSNQDSDTRYAAVEKKLSKEDVFLSFEEAVTNLADLALALPNFNNAPATVINRSIFEVKPADFPADVGLVITSPPYPNAYEYWLYHKYRMWWLGFNPLNVKSQEIGARAHFFSGERRKEEDFEKQMSKVFALLSEVMKESAYCCFVVGDSKIHGEIIDNGQLLENAASGFGFKLIFKSDRAINPHRKSFNLHHARIKREKVLIWQR